MTITIELTPEQEARLQAQAQGKPLQIYVQEVLADLLPQLKAQTNERAYVDEQDTLGKLIASCQIDTNIPDLAHLAVTQRKRRLRNHARDRQVCG